MTLHEAEVHVVETVTDVDPTPDIASMSDSALAEGARKVADNPDVQKALQAVVDLAMTSCSCEGASVTLVRADGGAETTATSSAQIEQADDLQYAYDEGPCLRAAEQGGAYLIVNTASDPRWPTWGPAVAKMGLRSVLSIHLFTDHRVLGALNLYYETHDDFSDDEIEVAKVVAAHASVALAKVRSERDLWRAIDSRHLIGQAQGMLMERFGLTEDQSFALLQRLSSELNRKLRDVAHDIVSTREMPSFAEDGHPVRDGVPAGE